MLLFWKIAVVISCFKLLLLYAYRSTDFEVHRNWMAIVHSLPLDKWYLSDMSQWTLDYPPLFAWMEKCFSYVAALVDPRMLVVTNLNYASYATVAFQRISVIVSDYVLIYAVIEYAKYSKRKSTKTANSAVADSRLILVLLLVANVGLLIIDHIHFQYNGILFGILILSILRIYQDRPFEGAFWFAILLNMKHIYLYIAPSFGVYLLRNACFQSTPDGKIIWKSFSLRRCFCLAAIVLLVFSVSFGPFILKGQLFQVLSRLFPFKRGLCHAYWAPNFWAVYNVLDKGLAVAGRRMNLVTFNSSSASMTGGLVQEFEHSVLPTVKPIHTFLLTVAQMLPIVIRTWFCHRGISGFIQCLTLCAFSAFMFGWHVHEKAILLIIIPLTLLALEMKTWAKVFLLLSTVGHYSLFPLIYTTAESPIKYGLFLIYAIFAFYSLGIVHSQKRIDGCVLPFLNIAEVIYLLGFVFLHLYNQFLHHLFHLDKNFPFLPLLFTSVYCAVGVSYLWIVSLREFLNF